MAPPPPRNHGPEPAGIVVPKEHTTPYWAPYNKMQRWSLLRPETNQMGPPAVRNGFLHF
jgi:hypothetical protein